MLDYINTFLTKIPLSMIFGGCMLVGLAYSFIILIFGGQGDSGGAHHGFFSDMFGGTHHGGDISAGAALHINFFSPLSITTFLTGFGSFGLITLDVLKWEPVLATFSSGGAAVVLNLIVTFAIYKIFIASQTSSISKMKDLIGFEAEVITAIPAQGVGEIAYTSDQGRQTALARSYKKEVISKGETVRIVKFIGTAAHVAKIEEAPKGTTKL